MRFLSLLACAIVAVVGSCTPANAGSVLGPSRSVGAPPGFASACHRYSWLCGSPLAGRAMGDAEALSVLRAANAQVNAALIPTGGMSAVGRIDYWSLPINGRGDCKHYALLKKKTLIANGFRADRLAVAVVLDRNGNNHAVLMARLNGGDYVLDNLTDSIRSWDDTGYTFLARQNFQDQRKWEVILAGPRAGKFQGT
ncbi:transglutaminase-like cysteine peptidase [Rhizobium tubonense]|uniref:Transglutaminase n=1 Tax=Rhizobium tubonense TaxID=484088 RepID=A0A2W4C9C8_9HYPH|nr:transglutaminase-like cysteine peptidase [Rhizobium tubonense]PZM09989.1 hypothetical protein CPY51_24210 [Rhizobium tubonense]